MEFAREPRHQRAASRRRTSAQGTVSTAPLSSSATPSLGPTAFLFFFFVPRSPAAAPRHALYGHAIGLLCGYGSLWLCGLQHAPSAMTGGISDESSPWLSLALTGVCMIACRAVHPPASATTLIVSLGIVTMPRKLVIIEVAVALLTLQAIVINRHAGIDYPLWTLHEYRRQEPG